MTRRIPALTALMLLAVVCFPREARAFVDFCGPWRETIRQALTLSPQVAAEFKAIRIDPVALLCALIDQESDGRADARQFEASFYRAHVKKAHARREIRRIRSAFNYPTYHRAARDYSTAYGLIQILYASARIEGYGAEPDGLKDPLINLLVGARHLLRKLQRAKSYHPHGNPREILLWTLRFWNGSANRDETLAYALSVEKQYHAYRRILRGEAVVLASK